MTKLNDYSGPILDNAKLEDFSYEFVIKLAREWQSMAIKWHDMDYKYMEKTFGKEKADEWEEEFWDQQAQIAMPRMAKLANIEIKDIVDYLKVGQLILEGTMGVQPLCTYELVNGNRNDVIWTCNRCLALEFMEKFDQERIVNMCQVIEESMMRKYVRKWLPDVDVIPLKLPPRKSKDEIACKFELKRPT